jgi:hypothetical protein
MKIKFNSLGDYIKASNFLHQYAVNEKMSTYLWEDKKSTYEGEDLEINLYRKKREILIEGKNIKKINFLEKNLKKELEREIC